MNSGQVRSIWIVLISDKTPVTAVKINGAYIAAGHASGSLYLWDLTRPSKPIRVALALPAKRDGHTAAITHIDFCPTRHTCVVTGDETGKAFWWSLGILGGIDVIRILGSDRRNSSLFSVTFLGAELVALQTPVKLVVIAMKSEPKTVYRKERAFAETGCAAWNGSVLAYSWADNVYMLGSDMVERGHFRVGSAVRSMDWYEDKVSPL